MFLQKVQVLAGEAPRGNFLSLTQWRSASETATGNNVSVDRSFLVYQRPTWVPHEQNPAVFNLSQPLSNLLCFHHSWPQQTDDNLISKSLISSWREERNYSCLRFLKMEEFIAFGLAYLICWHFREKLNLPQFISTVLTASVINWQLIAGHLCGWCPREHGMVLTSTWLFQRFPCLLYFVMRPESELGSWGISAARGLETDVRNGDIASMPQVFQTCLKLPSDFASVLQKGGDGG